MQLGIIPRIRIKFLKLFFWKVFLLWYGKFWGERCFILTEYIFEEFELVLKKKNYTFFRYHSGTIAYASSPVTFIPMIYIIYKHGRERWSEMYKKPVLILSWLIMLWNFSFDGLIMSAIHGTTFYKSAKESYILMMKNPKNFLTITAVSIQW